jgi:Fe-S cluster biogenesis protein NfuA/nitrite reductase/ring-hydroxylating ferredoxin subunit
MPTATKALRSPDLRQPDGTPPGKPDDTPISTPPSPPGNRSPLPPITARQQAAHIQDLIEKIGALPAAAARDLLLECLQSVLAFYGGGLERILQLTRNAGADAQPILDALVRDDWVRSLLLIHDLHPQNLETRLRGALAKIRPYLESHGGNVELISLENDVARLRLHGTCRSCPSSSVTLELAVRQTVEDACPDLADFEVEGVDLATRPAIPRGLDSPRWTVLDHFEPLAAGAMRLLSIDGVAVLLCNANGPLYAYRNACAVCAASLADGSLADGVLRCPAGHRFDVRRAGVCPEDAAVHLDPFPLLAVNGSVKIAVPR